MLQTIELNPKLHDYNCSQAPNDPTPPPKAGKVLHLDFNALSAELHARRPFNDLNF